jgi:hypothetical protein
LGRTVEDELKQFKQTSFQRVMTFFRIMLNKGIQPEKVMEVFSNVLATHMLLTTKFAYELKEKGVDIKQLDEIVDATIPIGFTSTENSKAACESIKESIHLLVSEIDKIKKEQLH